jgi:hypothetical protein
MSLVSLDATSFAFYIIPEPDARIQRPCQYIFAVGREVNRRDWSIIFVDESPEALPCRSVPDTDESIARAADNERAVSYKIYPSNGI